MTDYDERAALRAYLWNQFPYLCTEHELQVYKASIGKAKAAQTDDERGHAAYRRMFGDWEHPEIAAELAEGFDRFTERVLDRIRQEHGDLFYVNRCAECGRITRSPRACMCPWCGHKWYEQRSQQYRIANEAINRAKSSQ